MPGLLMALQQVGPLVNGDESMAGRKENSKLQACMFSHLRPMCRKWPSACSAGSTPPPPLDCNLAASVCWSCMPQGLNSETLRPKQHFRVVALVAPDTPGMRNQQFRAQGTKHHNTSRPGLNTSLRIPTCHSHAEFVLIFNRKYPNRRSNAL